MPPTNIHLNGSINLGDADEVFATLAATVGDIAHAYPDGETDNRFGPELAEGNRQYWIYFQVPALEAAEGLLRLPDKELFGDQFPNFTTEPDSVVRFGNLGYADAYLDSYQRFLDARADGKVPIGVKFQAQFPTPSAVIDTFVVPEFADEVRGIYQQALLAEIQRLTDLIPLDDLAIQWDIATEIGAIEGWYGPRPPINAVASSIIPLIEAIDPAYEVGLHLCYGDYKHKHLSEPEDLSVQVALINAIHSGVNRFVDFVSFTVPQDRSDPEYFEPLREYDAFAFPYFGIIAYHPEVQAAGVTERQIELIDEALEGEAWGVSTECGLGRVEREMVKPLLVNHTQVVLRHGILDAAEV